MIKDKLKKRIPKLYGATIVGERGQIVIPVEARRDMNINPGEKLIIFGAPHGRGLMITKAETMSEFMNQAIDFISRFNKIIETREDSSDKAGE